MNDDGTKGSTSKSASFRSSWAFDEVWNAWQELEREDNTNTEVDWFTITAALRRESEIACYSDAERDRMLLLHLVVGLHPPLNVVEAIITANPSALSSQSTNGGLTPLMIACGRNASRRVVRLLISKDRKALDLRDASGYAAIHWACRENASHEVMKQVLLNEPGQAWRMVQKPAVLSAPHIAQHHVGGMGMSPLDILYQINSSSSGQSSSEWDRNQWKKLTYLLWVRHYGSMNARSEHSYSVLHAALALKCPADVVDTAIRLHCRDVAGIRDVHGNLPLHYAVQSWTVTGAHISQIISAFPHAAMAKDGKGRLPLHEALKSGKAWHEGGVSTIYDNFTAVSSKDEETTLPPAFLAASYSDLDATFTLLREYPQVATTSYCSIR
jgi:ankyrin repeat protein